MNNYAIIAIGTKVRDKDYGINGEVIDSYEHSGWVVNEVLWERKLNGSFTSLEFIEDIEIINNPGL